MAPRRGGGGGYYDDDSGSSGSACEYCNEPVTLYGSDWKSSYTTGNFAICCICLALLLGCLIFSKYYRQWRSTRGYLSKFGAWTYIAAVLSTMIYLILTIIITALNETEATVTYSYLVIYVFISAFYWASFFLILVLLARFVEDGTSTGQRKFGLAIKVVVGLLSLLAISDVGLIITHIAYELNSLYGSGYFYLGVAYILELVINVIYLCTVVGIAVVFIRTARVYAGRAAYRIILAVAAFVVFFSAVLGVAQTAIAVSLAWGYGYDSYTDTTQQFLEAASVFSSLLGTVALILFLLLARSGARTGAAQPKVETTYNA